MKILITGVAGLIGSHLADTLLDDGHNVFGIDNLQFGNLENLNYAKSFSSFTFLNGDIRDICNHDETYDVMYHLASLKKVWDGSIKSSDVMDVNYEMTKMAVSKSLSDNSFLIFSSTSDIYGNSDTFLESSNITMGPPGNTRYSYALSKWHSEQFILSDQKERNLKSCVARIFGCASPRSNTGWSGGHVPLFIDLALSNKEIHIHGNGLQTRSISHAIDIASGLKNISYNNEKTNGKILNLGTDQETTVKYVAEYIVKKTESKSKIFYDNNIFGNYNEIQRRYANTGEAKSLIGYKTTYTTEEVIDQIVMSRN